MGENRMKIALRFGLLITSGVIIWTIVAHLLVSDPRSPVHTLGAGIFFNILHLAGIFLAISTVSRETTGELTFKDGLKTGMATALVYALSSSVFFLAAIAVVGSKLMASEPGAENMPLWKVALGAFAGLFMGSLIFGLIYSTVVSFFFAKRKDA